jgi:hypothetical protein
MAGVRAGPPDGAGPACQPQLPPTPEKAASDGLWHRRRHCRRRRRRCCCCCCRCRCSYRCCRGVESSTLPAATQATQDCTGVPTPAPVAATACSCLALPTPPDGRPSRCWLAALQLHSSASQPRAAAAAPNAPTTRGWAPTHVHNDRLAAAALHVDLLGAGDVQVTQVGLQLTVGGLQVEQGLRHLLLKVIGLLRGGRRAGAPAFRALARETHAAQLGRCMPACARRGRRGRLRCPAAAGAARGGAGRAGGSAAYAPPAPAGRPAQPNCRPPFRIPAHCPCRARCLLHPCLHAGRPWPTRSTAASAVAVRTCPFSLTIFFFAASILPSAAGLRGRRGQGQRGGPQARGPATKSKKYIPKDHAARARASLGRLPDSSSSRRRVPALHASLRPPVHLKAKLLCH